MAKKYFTAQSRTVAILVPESESAEKKEKPAGAKQ